MTFDEALAYRKRMSGVRPMNEQDFRHGWNRGIEAALGVIAQEWPTIEDAAIERLQAAVRALEVEVQT